MISVPTTIMNGRGTSKCVVIARRILQKRDPERVNHLPSEYDGDRIFELPPFVGNYSRGAFFLGMERKLDCFLWGRMIETQASIGPQLNNNKNSYKIGFVKCLGSLQCMHKNCPHFESKAEHNRRNWTRDRAGKNEHPFPVGKDVLAQSVICSFCKRPPRCIAGCPAEMWYITPSADDPHYRHKSRVAMHVGSHTHPGMLKHSKHNQWAVR
jgi:hypothetical protein